MYTFPNKLRNIAFSLMVVGLIGIVYGFLSAPKTIQDVEKIVAESHHGGHHGKEAHAEHVTATHETTNEGHEKATTEEHAVENVVK